jgi:hypothetical protein
MLKFHGRHRGEGIDPAGGGKAGHHIGAEP